MLNNIMGLPKISVIVPTRERCDVLRKSLQTITDQDYDNLEIIVSDNQSSDDTEGVVRDIKDSRIKYITTGKRLSMSHNWEFALSHVKDGWVTIVGDDDGILPASVTKIADIIRSSSVQAIRSRCCYYQWPSLTGKGHGVLSVPLSNGSEIRDSALWLSRMLEGKANYHDLPMLYTGGYISVSAIDRIRAKTGQFYRSCAPDVYSAIAISSVLEKYLFLHEPLAIFGLSKHSTGASAFSREESTHLSPVQRFSAESNIPFHRDIPLSPDGSYPASMQAVEYEAFLQSALLRTSVVRNIHAQQLEVILATSRFIHKRAVQDWGKSFAAAHGIDYDEAQSRARRNIWLKAITFSQFVYNFINTWETGSPDNPIRDVHEACTATATVRHIKPSRLWNIQRLILAGMARIN